MKFQSLIILVFAVTANFGGTFAKLTDIPFPLKLLQPDLRAFSQYYENYGYTKNNIPYAYLEWPDYITYQMQWHYSSSERKNFVKIDGIFETTKMPLFAARYEAIYYKAENDGFYVPVKDSLKPISEDTMVRYVQTITTKPAGTYLSIRYFSLNELKTEIEAFYSRHSDYLKEVANDVPTTYLATPPNPGNHFVEYTFLGYKHRDDTCADGKLRVLVGAVKKGKLNLENNTDAHKLVYDIYKYTCEVHESFIRHSKEVENVFGVRMASVGFLSEVRQSEQVMTFSSKDLIKAPASKQSKFFDDLLQKVLTVDPRFGFEEYDNAKEVPKSVQFQVLGQVFVKKINYLETGGVDKKCPFTIEYAQEGRTFQYGPKKRLVEKICVNKNALREYD